MCAGLLNRSRTFSLPLVRLCYTVQPTIPEAFLRVLWRSFIHVHPNGVTYMVR
jgi:hypothetical protein